MAKSEMTNVMPRLAAAQIKERTGLSGPALQRLVAKKEFPEPTWSVYDIIAWRAQRINTARRSATRFEVGPLVDLAKAERLCRRLAAKKIEAEIVTRHDEETGSSWTIVIPIREGQSPVRARDRLKKLAPRGVPIALVDRDWRLDLSADS